MDKVLKTDFEVSFDVERMSMRAKKIAQDLGITDPNEIDAFRHAYTSAKVKEKYGEKVAQALGVANEVAREVRDRVKTRGREGNDRADRRIDLVNNVINERYRNTFLDSRPKASNENNLNGLEVGPTRQVAPTEVIIQPSIREQQAEFSNMFADQSEAVKEAEAQKAAEIAKWFRGPVGSDRGIVADPNNQASILDAFRLPRVSLKKF